MENNLLCSCVCLHVCLRTVGVGLLCYDYACTPKVICSSNATLALVGVIQGKTKQFPPSFSPSLKYISVLLAHHDLGRAAAGLWYSVLQCCSAVAFAAFRSIAEGAHAVLGKAISLRRVWCVTLPVR